MGESIGASVEIVTVHKAKGLEYPIVIVADLFTDKLPAGNCIIDHAARRGWLKIGKFLPDGWEERSEAEALQQDAEGRRLLYVALTRARDHLVIPCLPGDHVKSWLGPVANTLVRPLDEIPFGKCEKNVTWFDSRRLVFGVQGPTAPRVSMAVDGSALDAQNALDAEDAWLIARRTVLKQARVAAEPMVTPSHVSVPAEADESASTGAQRLYGSEPEGDLAELSQTSDAVGVGDEEAALFGSYLHAILATVDLSGANVEPVARTLARQYGVTEASTARAIQMVERLLRLPLMDEARAATRIFREVPLAGNASTGRAQGNVDLLFESGRVWRVVDFKTDRYDAHDSVREHMAQLALYSSNLTQVVGADVKPAICLVRLGEIVELR